MRQLVDPLVIERKHYIAAGILVEVYIAAPKMAIGHVDQHNERKRYPHRV